jgi:ribosome-binding factor A
MGLRQDKFSKQVLRDLSELFNIKKNDWLGGAFVTISNVSVSLDLGHVKVYLSLYNNPNKAAIMEQLDAMNKEIRHALSQRLRNSVKKMPEVHFYEDDTLEYVAKMEDLLKSLNTPKD